MGKVLVAGGYDDSSGYIAKAELYDSATGTWTLTGILNTARELHTATLLSDGKVLVAAGDNGLQLASAELYDPATGLWSFTGSLNEGRTWHTGTLLANGKVLVAAGYQISGDYLASAELYDPGIAVATTVDGRGASTTRATKSPSIFTRLKPLISPPLAIFPFAIPLPLCA
jgi:hypothetical protein